MKECALLGNLFYKNDDCPTVALKEFRPLKGIKKKGVVLLKLRDRMEIFLIEILEI